MKMVSTEHVTAKPEHPDMQWCEGRRRTADFTDEQAAAPSVVRQQTVRSYFHALDTYFEAKDAMQAAGVKKFRPPYRKKRYYKACWTNTTIKVRDGHLELQTLWGHAPIRVAWPYDVTPTFCEIVWQDGQHVLCAQYKGEDAKKLIRTGEPKGDKTAAVDLGEVYLASMTDGEKSTLFSGRQLQHLRQKQQREKSWFDSRIDRKKKGSRRFWKLVKAKKRRLGKIRNQISDLLHKLTTRLVEEAYDWGCAKIVIGDVTGIRARIAYGRKMNQRLHIWAFKRFYEKVEYKARRYGMKVELIEEAYTSRTCPSCGSHNDREKRRYACTACGYRAHSDAVGASNIRRKYLAPALWAGVQKAVRTTATESQDSTGTPKRGMKRSSPLSGEVAAAWTRTTPRNAALCSPQRVSYMPHMPCVLKN
jgi:putative transposase